MGVWGVWTLGPGAGRFRGTDARCADASVIAWIAWSRALCLIDDQECQFEYTVKS